MKKILLIPLMILFCMSLVFAGNDYYISFTDGNSDVDNIGYETFLCDGNNGACNTVSKQLNDGNTGESETYHFNALGTTNLANYAAYFYADEYLPVKALFTDNGFGEVARINYELEKAKNCIAPITRISVLNEAEPNMPLTINVNAKLDADTASAFSLTNRVPNYQPDSWRTTYRKLFSATTYVDLTVEKDGEYVTTITADPKDIFADETATFSFNYVPQSAGLYTFTFTATVDDAQCESSQSSVASDTTNVVPTDASDYSYVLIDNLQYAPIKPIVGETIDFSVDYLANHVSTNGDLSTIPTEIEFTLRQGFEVTSGPYIDTFTGTYSDSTVDDFATADYFKSVTESGWYTLHVIATPIGPGDILGGDEYITVYVGENEQHDYELQVFNLDGEILDGVRGVLNTGRVVYSTSEGIIDYENLYAGTYNYTLTLEGYHDYTGSFILTNSDNSGMVYMTPLDEPNPANNTFTSTIEVFNLDGQELVGVLGILDTGAVKASNLEGQIVYEDLVPGTHSFTLSLDGYKDYTGNFEIVNDNVTITVFMQEGTNPNPNPNPDDGYKDDEPKSTSALIDIDFDAIDYQDISDLKYTMLTFKNSGTQDIDDVIVTISIPELAIWDKIGPFDLDDGKRVYKKMRLDYPQYEPGWYYLRVQLDGKNYNRARWYEVYLK